MRFTIERLRWLVLAAGILLIAALAVFLVIGKWRSPFNRRDLPKRLGVDIQQEANGFTYTQAHGGHTLFKIQASRVVQLKQGYALLHDVHIDLYGADDKRVDSIEGNEFEYNQQEGTARATGEVEITLMRPDVAPLVAPKANARQAMSEAAKNGAVASAAQAASQSEIHVKTSGLVFNQNSGLATTSQPVEFLLAQGSGSATGASYDSQQGKLILDRGVHLNLERGGEPVRMQAQHAEFERNDQVCRLTSSVADYRGSRMETEEATISFRDDGSASRLEASHGFTLTTAAGSRLAAPTGTLDFDEQNQPSHGLLQGGVTIDSDARGRTLHGSAPRMDMDFTSEGVLRRAHLERGVKIVSDQQTVSDSGPVRTHQTWASPLVDLAFRSSGQGAVELDSMHGTGGVTVTDETQRGNGPVAPARMTADDVTGTFGPGSVLTGMTGTGHASIAQTTPSGARQTTSGDRLVAHFAPVQAAAATAGAGGKNRTGPVGSMQIESATVEGNVVMVQEPAAKAGMPAGSPMRATGARAVYQGDGENLHLTGSPRVQGSGVDIAADTIDVSEGSGDATAHGDVKATWVGGETEATGKAAVAEGGLPSVGMGGQGPTHAIAEEAQVHQASGEVTFRGHARLWQMTNSISAPVIVLDRTKQTLVARAAGAADPVRVVLVSAASQATGKQGKPSTPSVIRVRGGDLKYSAAERKAVLHGGALGNVAAEAGGMTCTSSEVELVLLPPGNHAGKDGAPAQVDRMTARGHVDLTAQGRRGTGERLDYSSESGEYELTGTAARPPRLVDPVRGSVSGEVLIFNSHDDSVKVESSGRRTTTETTAPK